MTIAAAYAPTCRPAAEQRLEDSLLRAVDWVESHDYRAYEPADGNSSVLFPLTGGRVLPMRVLQQIVLRAPFNIRPFIGIRPHESAIARGYMAWGYLAMFRRSRRQSQGRAWTRHKRSGGRRATR